MLILRPRIESDLEVVVAWVADADELTLFSGPRLIWPLTAAQLREMERIPGLTAWTVEDESIPCEPVGHFDLSQTGDVVRIGRVIVDPALRGRGLGAELMKLAIDRARVLGASVLRLNVIVGNDPAIRTYARLGFAERRPPDRPDVLSMILGL